MQSGEDGLNCICGAAIDSDRRGIAAKVNVGGH